MLSVGLAGKPNSGKSTFFKAATLVDVDIANYPFTTIDANHGVSYVRVPCPCKELGIEKGCGKCKDGVRFIAIELIDVAGLVPDAHLGKGLGNEFLDASAGGGGRHSCAGRLGRHGCRRKSGGHWATTIPSPMSSSWSTRSACGSTASSSATGTS